MLCCNQQKGEMKELSWGHLLTKTRRKKMWGFKRRQDMEEAFKEQKENEWVATLVIKGKGQREQAQ